MILIHIFSITSVEICFVYIFYFQRLKKVKDRREQNQKGAQEGIRLDNNGGRKEGKVRWPEKNKKEEGGGRREKNEARKEKREGE